MTPHRPPATRGAPAHRERDATKAAIEAAARSRGADPARAFELVDLLYSDIERAREAARAAA